MPDPHLLRFGLCLPSFAASGAGLFRTPGFDALDPRLPGELAEEAEAAGFDSVWLPDHCMIGRDDTILDGWTTLAFVAARTRRVRLGLIQQSMLFRHPPLLARMAATLDVLSDGRLTLFSSFGRARAEHVAYGFPWPEDEAARRQRFVQDIDAIRALWRSAAPVTLDAGAFSLRDAVCRPAPVQAPHPPLWFTGTAPEVLSLCASVGAGWNAPPSSPEELSGQLASVATACRKIGRAPQTLEISMETQVLVDADPARLARRLRAMIAADPAGTAASRPPVLGPAEVGFLSGNTDVVPQALTQRWLIGAPDAVAARIATYAALGVGHFLLWFMDLPDRNGLRHFSAMLPMLRTAGRSSS